MTDSPPSLDAIQMDFRLLDGLEESAYSGARAIVHEDFPGRQVLRIDPPAEPVSLLGHARFAWTLLRAAGARRHALLLNQVDRFASLACLLNRCLPPKWRRRIVLYDVFIDSPSWLRRRLVRWMVEGATINVLFSRAQVDGYARLFRLPRQRFAYVPYQSSHSKRPPVTLRAGERFGVQAAEGPRELEAGSYVFSGGNSARDYRTLCAAVRGTGLRVLLTTTDERLLAGVDVPEEIERVTVREPDFTRLMAGARFVVMPLTAGRVRGFGEQTILNSWWHGRAVVVADDVSAPDLIEEGLTGFRVDPGDVASLRDRLVRLWRDPARAEAMGAAGQAAVRASFTHDHFVHRMKMLTLALAAAESV